MGIVGRFIDQVCESHPQLMQAVLERPLAPLHRWLAWDEANGACGCLIGTIALAAGYVLRKRDTSPPFFSGVPHYATANAEGSAIAYAALSVGMNREDVVNVGWKVASIARHVDSDDRTVHLLRQRIARSLVIRQARDPKYVEAGERYLAGVA